MNKHFSTTGIVIRKTDLNEADRIITVLTEDRGKIDCIAKGARRFSSKFCGRLELFSQIKINCYQGRELAIINEAELISCFSDTQDLRKHRVLFYLAELTNRLVHPSQQIEGAYQLIAETLSHIGSSEKTEILLHSYLIKLLTITGFIPPWNRCSKCGVPLDLEKSVRMSFNSSPICHGCASASGEILNTAIIKLVNFMQNHPLSGILNVKPSAEESDFVWHWLRGILDELLSSPIKSEEFLKSAI